MRAKSKKIRIEWLSAPGGEHFQEKPRLNCRTVAAVRGALARLSPTEREIVERFHFCGNTYAEIGDLLNLPEVRVYAIHKEAKRKLKMFLRPYVQKRYGLRLETDSCWICQSAERETIEQLLTTKTKEETWKRILRKLFDRYRTRANPRSLERHLKQHQHPTGKRGAASTA